MPDLPVALVTGSARGIGRAIVLELAQQQHTVVINYVNSRAAAEQLATEIELRGGRALALQGDVARTADRQMLLDRTLDTFGRIDVLVNNAGISSPGRQDLLEASEQSWDAVFETNLKGPFFLSQIIAKAMIESIAAGKIASGKIINISSISAYTASSDRGDYCMTKAALQMMTWLLADRLASERIGVFEICPGIIASDMTAGVQDKYDRLIADGLMPIRRWGQPADVARAVAAIVLDYFPFSTGQRIDVDGGFHLRRL